MPNRAFPYEPRYRDDFNRIRSRVYRGGDPVRDDEDLLPEDCSGTLVENDGRIVGAATSIHYNCTFGSKTMKSAGVAAVGVLPEARRSGAGSELMVGVNRQMREEGFAMALLYPYSANFYRQFGYEYAGNRLTINCPSNRMPSADDVLPIREIGPEQWHELAECYTSFAKRYNGMNHRNDLQWSRALGMEKPFAIFAAGDPIEAYALIRLEGTFWVEQSVREFVWSTPRGYRSILSFLKGLGANKKSVSWFEPSESPWLAQFGERDVTITADQQVMWRVLDVPGVLAQLGPEESLEFTLEVIDPEFSENVGPWRISSSNGTVEVERCDRADLKIGVAQIAQAIVGEPSFGSLVRFGAITSTNDGALKSAEKFFDSGPGYCLEFF